MIPVPQGWSRLIVGDCVLLAPPEGPEVAAISYEERLPLRRLRDVARERLAADPGAIWGALGPAERTLTHEGEEAALLHVDGTFEGAAARRVLAMTFADDICTIIDGVVRATDRFADFVKLVRTLLRRDSLGLGTLRRRRFFYRRPAGWQVVTRGLVAELTPADFPDNQAMITVFPANPSPLLPRLVLDEMMAELAGLGPEVTRGPTPTASKAGLEGLSWTLTTRDFVRELAVFSDGRFLYTAHLDSAPARFEEHRGALRTLLATAEPIPDVVPRGGIPTAVGNHWVD